MSGNIHRASPDMAIVEYLRSFQLYLVDAGTSPMPQGGYLKLRTAIWCPRFMPHLWCGAVLRGNQQCKERVECMQATISTTAL